MKLFSLIDKAIFEYNLIESGDRILIGASGGKDSTALIEYFSERMKRPNPGFTFSALNIQTEFSGSLSEGIVSLFKDWNVNLITLKVDMMQRIREGKKMNCYWCSTQRRTELKNYAVANGFNKIALGHHLDDVLETALMNALNKGELCTMIPHLKYEKYPVSVIRPLYYCPESAIIAHTKERGYNGGTCTCNYQENSARKSARQKLECLTDGNPLQKRRLLSALKNVNVRYLP